MLTLMRRNHLIAAKTFKYWEIFLSWIFKYRSRCYELNSKVKTCILKNPSNDFHAFGRTYRKKGGSKGIICQVTPYFKDIKHSSNILQLIHHTLLTPYLCELASCEVMAKVMAYRNLKVGHKIFFPTMTKDGSMVMTTYIVDYVFDLWSKIHAFGLIPQGKDGAPILLFRGTQFSFKSEESRASIISDLDPKGPGKTLFYKAEKSLIKWFKKHDKKSRIIGHSLGGIMLTYTLLHCTEYISQESHETSFAFNFPGLDKELIKKWDEIKEKPRFKGYITRGDIISKFGMLFGDIYEVSLRKPLSPVRAHEQIIFSEPFCYLNKVDIQGENRSLSRQFYSEIQKKTSSVIYELGLKFFFPY